MRSALPLSAAKALRRFRCTNAFALSQQQSLAQLSLQRRSFANAAAVAAASSTTAEQTHPLPHLDTPLEQHQQQQQRQQSDSFQSTQQQDTTHFGYRDVPKQDKQNLVRGVFDNVASSYDVMNDAMSFGIHRVWKEQLLNRIRPTVNTRLLDVAGGTGDVAFRVVEAMRAAMPAQALSQPNPMQQSESDPQSTSEPASMLRSVAGPSVVVCDINTSMLGVGRSRAERLGYLPQSVSAPFAPASFNDQHLAQPQLTGPNAVDLRFVEGNAEHLPFASNQFDTYTIAFGLRNVTNTRAALADALRVLRRGGMFACLEFSGQLDSAMMQRVYDAYSFNVIPPLGQVLAGDRDSYQYLVESIRKFHTKSDLAQLMREAGMRCVSVESFQPFGIAVLHTGYKL